MNTRKGFRPSPQAQRAHAETEKLMRLFHAKKWAELEPMSRAFMKANPQWVFGPKALAACLIETDRLNEALEVIDQALPKFKLDSELHNNKAALLIKQGRCEAAIGCANDAIRLDPRNGSAYANRGLAYKKLGAFQSGLESYYKAIELNPNDYEALNNAGVALIEMEAYEQAIVCLEASLSLHPNYVDAMDNLGWAKENMKLFKDAQAEYLKTLQVEPDNAHALSRLVGVLRKQCDFDATHIYSERLLRRIRSDAPLGPIASFNILSVEHASLDDQRKASYADAQAEYENVLNQPPLVTSTLDRSLNRPLRIGYLSADFHHHATLMLMIGMLEAHSPDHVEVFNYSLGTDDNSDLRRRAQAACKVFRNLRPLSHLEAARQIAADKIDILVDLKGFTKDARLGICALRPAPIIVSWLGYPGTLGHPRLADYIIGDPIVTPLEHQAYYSETLALLPHCYQPNDSHRPIAERPSRESQGLPEDKLVFCSFNQTYKITAVIFDQWCRLLNAVPNSVLWLMADKSETRKNLLGYANSRGLGSDRFVFAPHAPIHEHLGRLQNADIGLDTFPYGSHTTGSDALWAGVPLIAIKGDTFASRVSASLLANVGLPELITDSPAASCDLAISLAQDPSRLSSLKARLRANRSSCHLFNTVEFTRDMERMYRRMWEHHLAGKTEAIVLPPGGR